MNPTQQTPENSKLPIYASLAAASSWILYKLFQNTRLSLEDEFQIHIHNRSISLQYITTPEECETSMRKLLDKKPCLLGLDAEWPWDRFSSKATGIPKKKRKVAVIQLCARHKCYIIQCYKWETLPKALIEVLTSTELSLLQL